MAHPTARQDARKNDPRLAAFRANAAGICIQSPQGKDSKPERSLADVVCSEAFGSGAFFIGKGDALVSKDPRFTNAACLSEEDLAEYVAKTGDYSYSSGDTGDTYDPYSYNDGYKKVYDDYLREGESNYYSQIEIEQYGIYTQKQYQNDLENGDLACAAPWASDEDPYDYEVAQGEDDPESTEPVLETEADLGPAKPAEETPSTPVAAAFNDAASGVESQPAEPAPAAEPESSPAVIKVAAVPVAAPAV